MFKKVHQSENRLKFQVAYCPLVIFPAKVSQIFSQYDFRVFAPLNLKCRMYGNDYFPSANERRHKLAGVFFKILYLNVFNLNYVKSVVTFTLGLIRLFALPSCLLSLLVLQNKTC